MLSQLSFLSANITNIFLLYQGGYLLNQGIRLIVCLKALDKLDKWNSFQVVLFFQYPFLFIIQ